MRETSEAVGEEGVAVDATNDALALARAPSKVLSAEGVVDYGALLMMSEAVVVMSDAVVVRREALIMGREAVIAAIGSVKVWGASVGRASASS